ncbi:camp-dependent protein kinase catalytic subunit [Tribonema minus]|uniref:Camp-dependent protein kinase catalytic subunit n=1 Tax=Tribonema minus TaxID=303371 RepID=A0A836CKK8_9STRA|nr:camp-dependent protein kinase catalytic subunit [Tribonema minus]
MLRSLRKHLGGKDADDEVSDRTANGNSTSPLRQFELLKTLGTGTFGRVRLVRQLSSGRYYALKISKKSAIIRLKQVEHVKNEVSLLSRIDHPGVVNLVSHFHDDTKLYLVMEYVEGGELFSHLRSAVRFSNTQSMIYAAEIVLTFGYLHSMNIAYRDLKPENLLLTREGRIKVADFGFAKVVETRTWTLCGTPEYLAPEIIQSKGHGKSVDWWALGILIFECLAGYPPFYDDNPVQIYQKILSGRFDMPRSFNSDAKDIVKQLLTEDRTKRLGCTRGGAASVQEHRWFAPLDWAAVRNMKHEAPFLPRVSGNGDTSNFETYPESVDGDSEPPLSAAERALFDDLDRM